MEMLFGGSPEEETFRHDFKFLAAKLRNASVVKTVPTVIHARPGQKVGGWMGGAEQSRAKQSKKKAVQISISSASYRRKCSCPPPPLSLRDPGANPSTFEGE